MLRRPACVIVLAGAVGVTAAAALAQEEFLRGRRSRGGDQEMQAANTPYDGRFVFVRLRYNLGATGGFGRRGGWDLPWAHDYPRADRNFMKILKEITYVSPCMDSNVLALDDPELFNFPAAYMSEPGFWTLSEAEAAGLRAYLLKGGFVIFDDFRGWHWDNFREQMARVLPGVQLVPLDVTHPIFHSFFEIASLDFVQFYDRGAKAVFYGAFENNDPSKRLLLIANYNNDIGEYWEFSDTGYVPIDLSNEAYKFGVNYVVYAMTH